MRVQAGSGDGQVLARDVDVMHDGGVHVVGPGVRHLLRRVYVMAREPRRVRLQNTRANIRARCTCSHISES